MVSLRNSSRKTQWNTLSPSILILICIPSVSYTHLDVYKRQVQPGETRRMQFSIPVEELRFYDVISQSLMVEEGCYIIGAGTSSVNILIKTEIQIPGKKTGQRDFSSKDT